MQGIKLPDYYTTWSAIDSLKVSIDGKEPVTYYLMENDVYGDETFYLVVTKDLKTIYETFDDIETCLRDELDTNDIKVVARSESVKEEADISESVQGKTCNNDINSLSKLLKRDFGKGTAKHEGNFRFTFKTDKGKTYDVVTSPVDSKDGEDAKKIKIDDILGPIDDEEYDNIEEAYREPVDDLSDSEAKELENLANNVIKENNKKIDENISIKDLDKQIADEDEEPVIDYANPNITSSPEQSKVVDINSIEGK